MNNLNDLPRIKHYQEKSNMKRLFIASVAVVIIVFAVTFFVCVIGSWGRDFPSILISLVIASFAAIVALIVVVAWAIPVHLLLQKFGYSNITWYIVAAIVPSFAFIYGLKPFGNDKPIDLFMQASFCSLAGSLGSVAFWYILVYRQRIKIN
jgi:ABC-type glycerol-3-phosphate transport system permease component